MLYFHTGSGVAKKVGQIVFIYLFLKFVSNFSPNLVANHNHIYPMRAIALDRPRTPRP